MFSSLGISEVVRSANGTQYSSRRFKRSNGIAERYVQLRIS